MEFEYLSVVSCQRYRHWTLENVLCVGGLRIEMI